MPRKGRFVKFPRVKKGFVWFFGQGKYQIVFLFEKNFKFFAGFRICNRALKKCFHIINGDFVRHKNFEITQFSIGGFFPIGQIITEVVGDFIKIEPRFQIDDYVIRFVFVFVDVEDFVFFFEFFNQIIHIQTFAIYNFNISNLFIAQNLIAK